MSENGGAAVQTGPSLSPDEEATHRQQLAEVYADEAEAAVAAIEDKLAGWQQTLKDKKADAKRLRAAAKEGRA